jgi:hypothetical protein
MVQCEYTRCGKTLEISDFKSQDVYPCCGMQIQQTITFPEPEPEPEVFEEVVLEQKPVEEKPAKKPAKKAAAKKKPAKKAKK